MTATSKRIFSSRGVAIGSNTIEDKLIIARQTDAEHRDAPATIALGGTHCRPPSSG